jgi:phospholipid-binding lipoprotein MlaA
MLSFGCTRAPGVSIPDPIEPVNRKIFWFNNKVDEYVLEPVAQGYHGITPKPIRNGITNFFRNLNYPVYLVSDLIQGKFQQAGVHTSRFLINTTIGIAGFIDIANDQFDMEHHPEDIGSALGYWGIGPGPYLILPFLGPSNGRDLIGWGGDNLLYPLNYAPYLIEDGEWIFVGMNVVDKINLRSRLLEAVKAGRESSLDYYTFVRSTYHQLRQNIIYDNNPPEEVEPEMEDDEAPDPEPEIID